MSQCHNRCGRERVKPSAYCAQCSATNRDRDRAAGRVSLPAGSAMAQCPVCRRLFTVVSAFDRHRGLPGCLGPASVGLVEHRRAGLAAWGYPDSGETGRPRSTRAPQSGEQPGGDPDGTRAPDAGRVRVWLAVLLAAVVLVALVGLHQWSEAQGEDQAPVWSCHTMGNGDCGPDSPWHGITTAP